MRYLMTIIRDKDTTYEYVEVTPEEERKITNLIQEGKLPSHWNFKGKRIATDTILGFTDKNLPYKVHTPKFKDFNEFRDWAHQQKWYHRNHPTEVATSKTPKPITLDLGLHEEVPMKSQQFDGR